MFEKQNWEITNLMSFVVQMSRIPVLFCDLDSWPDSISDNEQWSMALIVNIIFIQKEFVVHHGTCSLTKKVRAVGEKEICYDQTTAVGNLHSKAECFNLILPLGKKFLERF